MKRATLAVGFALALLACNDTVEGPTSPPRVQATPPPLVAPPPVPARPPTPVPEANDAPVLRISIRPDPPSGPLPREVTVNMCGSADPEGERLVYQYKWGGGAEHFSYGCRSSHVYETEGSYHAFFCVHDEHDHAACSNQRIDITP